MRPPMWSSGIRNLPIEAKEMSICLVMFRVGTVIFSARLVAFWILVVCLDRLALAFDRWGIRIFMLSIF